MASQTLQDTSLNFDEGQMLALLNDESITLNNSTLIINSDVRWAQNASVIGNMTISDTQGGEIRIRGDEVWELPFGGGEDHYEYAALLLGFDNEIIDESKNAKTVSVIGSPTPGFTKTGITMSHSGLDFTGTSHLAVDHTGTDFDFGSNNLMISFSMLSTDTVTTRIILTLNTDPVTNYAALQIGQSNGYLTVRSSANNSSWGVNSGISVLAAGQVNRVLITKFGTTWRIWINNTLHDTFTSSVVPMPYSSGMVHRVGARGNDGQRYVGMLDELLVVNGFAFDLPSSNLSQLRGSKWSRQPMTHANPTTGNVPVLGVLGANTVTGLTSGATGELIRVFSSAGYLPHPLPVTSGLAMPRNGFLKLRNKIGNFIAGETVTLPGGATAILSNEGRRSWIHIVGGQTRTVTIPRLGKFDVLGDYYYLGVTNGLDNQTFQCPVLDQLGGIQIETAPGSNEYFWWKNAGNRWGATPNMIPTDLRGRFFNINPSTGIITIAARVGTTIECGYKPPAGCKVRIPNIIASTSTSADWAANSVPSTLSTRYDFTTSGNGEVIISGMSCNWYLGVSGAYSFKMYNSTSLSSVSISNVSSIVELDSICVGLRGADNYNGLSVTQCQGDVNIFRAHACRFAGEATSQYAAIVENNDRSDLRFTEFILFPSTGNNQRTSNSPLVLLLNRIKTLNVYKPKLIGGESRLSTILNGTVQDIEYADQVYPLTVTATPVVAALRGDNIFNTVIKGFRNYENLANINPYGSIFDFRQSSDNVILEDIGTMDDPYVAGTNAPSVLVTLSFVNTNIAVRRCYVPGLRAGTISANNTTKGLILKNIWGPQLAQAISANDCKVYGCSWIRSTNPQNAVYGTHWSVLLPDVTSGPGVFNMIFNISFNEPSENTQSEMAVRGYGLPQAPCVLSHNRKGAAIVLSEDRLSTNNAIGYCKAVAALTTGLSEWEVTPLAGSVFRIGIGYLSTTICGLDASTVAYLSTGEISIGGVVSAYGSSYTTNDVITVLVDRVNNTISFKKNNVNQGVAFSSLTGTYYPMAGDDTNSASYGFNFGGLGKIYPTTAGYNSNIGMPVPKFTGTGRLSLPNFGDEVIAECPFFALGAIKMKNVSHVFTGANESNMIYEFQYDLGEGFNGTWLAMNSSNYNTVVAVSQDIGIRIKVRVTCDTPSSTNNIAYLRIDMNTDNYGARLLYPEKQPTISSKINNLIPGSRVQLYNVTKDTEVFNDIVTTSSIEEFSELGELYDLNDIVRVRVTYVDGIIAKLGYENTREITATGFSITISQADDTIYETNNIDGSTVIEFSKHATLNRILIDKADGETTVQRGYAWFVYMQNTEEGIRRLFGQFEAIDLVNYRRNVKDGDPWFFYNVRSEDVRISGGYVYSSDSSRYIASGSGSIFMDAGKAYAVETGVSGLTTPESELLNRIAILSTQTSVDEATKAAKLAVSLAAAV